VIDLDVLARDAARLEPLPVSVTRLATLVCDGEPALAQIVELVEYDQALTATLLRTANSSWSASRTEITTVKDAVVRLGAGPVLSLALAANVRARMGGAIPEYGLGEQDLWSHSVAASLAAELLTRVAQHRPPPETATAALLHDLGKLIIARYLDAELLEQLQAAQATGRTRMQAEIEVLGVNHAELGALIAQSWALPESLVRGIRLHHAPDSKDGAIACAVHLADVAAKTVGAGLDDNPDVDTYVRAMGELGVTPEGFDETCRLVNARFDEVRARFA
jgi:putative nucleotidyltransferase with HDIG domain